MYLPGDPKEQNDSLKSKESSESPPIQNGDLEAEIENGDFNLQPTSTLFSSQEKSSTSQIHTNADNTLSTNQNNTIKSTKNNKESNQKLINKITESSSSFWENASQTLRKSSNNSIQNDKKTEKNIQNQKNTKKNLNKKQLTNMFRSTTPKNILNRFDSLKSTDPNDLFHLAFQVFSEEETSNPNEALNPLLEFFDKACSKDPQLQNIWDKSLLRYIIQPLKLQPFNNKSTRISVKITVANILAEKNFLEKMSAIFIQQAENENYEVINEKNSGFHKLVILKITIPASFFIGDAPELAKQFLLPFGQILSQQSEEEEIHKNGLKIVFNEKKQNHFILFNLTAKCIPAQISSALFDTGRVDSVSVPISLSVHSPLNFYHFCRSTEHNTGQCHIRYSCAHCGSSSHNEIGCSYVPEKTQKALFNVQPEPVQNKFLKLLQVRENTPVWLKDYKELQQIKQNNKITAETFSKAIKLAKEKQTKEIQAAESRGRINSNTKTQKTQSFLNYNEESSPSKKIKSILEIQNSSSQNNTPPIPITRIYNKNPKNRHSRSLSPNKTASNLSYRTRSHTRTLKDSIFTPIIDTSTYESPYKQNLDPPPLTTQEFFLPLPNPNGVTSDQNPETESPIEKPLEIIDSTQTIQMSEIRQNNLTENDSETQNSSEPFHYTDAQ